MKISPETLDWLLDSDVSIQYQVYRDILKIDRPDLKEQISRQGWGARLLSKRTESAHWGQGFYQPKWTSSHYTLLELKGLMISQGVLEIRETIDMILRESIGDDGGINPSRYLRQSDVCINGMFLNYTCYFKAKEAKLKSVVDFILSQQLPDGGFNCRYNRQGARHSSLHSSISVLEGILSYLHAGYQYRKEEMAVKEAEAQEFLLAHSLFKSHRTAEIIDRKMLMLSYPSRWRYDILRALDYFREAGSKLDNRMLPAINVLVGKQRKDKTWPLQAKHPGHTHFDMEIPGQASRWNTLRALRVLIHFGIIESIS